MGIALSESSEPAARIERLVDWTGGQACERNLTNELCRQYIFFHSGGGRIDLAGNAQDLTPGCHAAIPAGAPARIWLAADARGIILSATETFLRSRVLPVLFVPTSDHWRGYGVPHLVRLCEGDENSAARDRILQELEQASERLGGFCDAAVIAYAFVIMGSSRPPAERSEPAAEGYPSELAPAQLVMRFRELIEKNFREHKTIQDYSSQLAVTPVRLARACKSTMDRTPLSLIHERIILEAKGELIYSSKSVAEIGYDLGFTDAAYFNRFFKQQTGEPPLQYRRSASAADSSQKILAQQT